MCSSAIITNIQKFSVHDGPGIRSIIFFKGCPLACEWCANPENINPLPELLIYRHKCICCHMCIKACPQNALSIGDDDSRIILSRDRCVNCGECANICSSQALVMAGEKYMFDEVKKKVDKDFPFYKNSGGGITFSGGEPLLHPEFIIDIASQYVEQGLNCAVETCGAVPLTNIKTVEPWIDIFLFDLKFVDNKKHKRYCGGSNEMILENLTYVSENKSVIVRMPIIPGINDSEEDLQLAGELFESLSPHINKVHCLPYHNLGVSKYDALGIEYKLNNVETPDDDYLKNVKRKLEKYGVDIQIGG